eukprot:gb/GECG01007272.1/.p1 GENE.gb/GECG01007272.1/~~gb/GECG01007272.1/.p1  ORF type:complete len:273 (+),score=39.13 gb/GECG01007272.1/:1-819(+)
MSASSGNVAASAPSSQERVGVKRRGQLHTDNAEKEMWLVKLPDVLCSSWGLHDPQNGLDQLGTLEITEDPSGRTTHTIHVDKSQLGDQARQVTPEKFKINLGPPQGHRVITLSNEGGGLMEGVATKSGTAVPDPKDPCYKAYSQENKRRRKEAEKNRPETGVLRDREIPQAVNQESIWKASKDPFETQKEEPSVTPRDDATLLSLYEEAAAWSRKNLLAALSRRFSEAKIREDMSRYCEYVQAGPNRGKYILKPEFRSSHSATLEEPNKDVK